MANSLSSLRRLFSSAIVGALLSAAALTASAQADPAGLVRDTQWATAGKQGVGTSADRRSKVWFTLAQGVMTEVYYPDVMTANVHLLQFIVVDPRTKKVETEQDDAIHQVKVLRPDSLTFQQINTAKSGRWKITKTYVTDTDSDSVLIDVHFETGAADLALYVYYDPSLGNSGWGDSGYLSVVDHPAYQYLSSEDAAEKVVSAVAFSSPISEVRGDAGSPSEAIGRLNGSPILPDTSRGPSPKDLVQTARIDEPRRFITLLSFGKDRGLAPADAPGELERRFRVEQSKYEKGWAAYVKALPRVEPKYQAQFNMAAMQLKAHEDKTHAGANIASLTVPWGGGPNANENNVGGYHLVWSRDLYQVATAFIALGDRAAANRALDFVLTVQQKPDGSFPQNSKLDGTPFWGSLQLDEVAFPLILAWQLGRDDRALYEKHLKKAADFIAKNGPATPQERWEEESGYSPSTIAAEIAGLVCAAEIAKKNGDDASARRWLATADDWAANVEKWTATTTGKYGDGNYYLRITQNAKPDAGEKIELNNGAGYFDERDIVDAGFLELVRLGVKPADDPLIAKSLKVIDQVIKVDTPNGPAFYRYNHDGYGEMEDGRRWNWDGKYTGKGRLWALLSGERGQYEIALCAAASSRSRTNRCSADPQMRLAHMAAFANEGLMIPEQIWDRPEIPANVDKQFIPELKFGEGTGSATPLAWSMAQFIRLATNLKAGRNLETPQVVYDRYVLGRR